LADAKEVGSATTPAADVTKKARRSINDVNGDDKQEVKTGKVNKKAKEQIWTCMMMMMMMRMIL
jgi:hypothetical protein